MVVLLLGAGLFYMVMLRFRPLTALGGAFARLWGGRKGEESAGDITPWQALSTALSGQVGTGNLAGVATAISLGGPGAIFWMWITALFGMALSFAEGTLAVRFREKHADGKFHGGPMYYIKNGLGKGWGWLAVLFCIGALLSAFATGNMIQSNSITNGVQSGTESFARNILPCQMLQPADGRIDVSACAALEAVADGGQLAIGATGEFVTADTLRLVMAAWIPGAVVAFFVFLVIIGGIKSIGRVAGTLVPFMAVAYVAAALIVLILHASHVPAAFMTIFEYAFGFGQAAGGVAGYAVMQAVRFGVARGLFSNEAGQGSLPIAHAAAQTKNPIRQGEMAMLGTFIDTIIICTMTALVILTVAGTYPSGGGETVEYAWQSRTLTDVAITSAAFAQGIPFGAWIIGAALALFAFTTLIGWSYYAEQSATYLVGDWAARPFRFLWVAMVFTGAIQANDFVWRLGDIANAAMALPNLIAILLLSGLVIKYVRDFDKHGIIPPAWNGAQPTGSGAPPAEPAPEGGPEPAPAGGKGKGRRKR
ncbi:MAG: alanine:cation symporter family protein [Maricaulaceae bacterium]|nr:alanine:cation symporter family protein [Maricaulaceae bacterium]